MNTGYCLMGGKEGGDAQFTGRFLVVVFFLKYFKRGKGK